MLVDIDRRTWPIMVRERQIPLLDLQAQHKHIREEVLEAVIRVIESQKFILGEEVRRLEEAIGPYCGASYAVGCASGSDALFLSLMALGVCSGDEVLTTPYTFFATAGAISELGARPVFADIEESTYNIDVQQISECVGRSPKIRAIIPVHLFGGCADMDSICEIAAGRNIPVIEDAAQAIGAEYKNRRAGSMGRMGAFSFYPTKNLGAYGDGGMITTDDSSLAGRLKVLRVHGSTGMYFHESIGINSRLDALQAAVLSVKLRHLDDWTACRNNNAAHYRRQLEKLSIPVIAPRPADYQTRHIYNQFVIRCPERDRLRAHLKERGIGTEIYYPLPLHLQPCYSSLGYKKGDFPVSEKMAAEALALPVHAELAADDIDYICYSIGSFYAQG